MDKNELLDKFGFCGLLCEKCFAYDKGQIKIHAEQLKNDLGEFDNYAKRFVSLLEEPLFEKYSDFKELLTLFSSGSCQGCRIQKCHLFKECKVRTCCQQGGIDYCFECEKFPCENTGFDENLKNRWLLLNKKIRKIGLENYYAEVKEKSRY